MEPKNIYESLLSKLYEEIKIRNKLINHRNYTNDDLWNKSLNIREDVSITTKIYFLNNVFKSGV